MATNSFISQNKNNNKNGAMKSFSVLRNISKNKSKSKNKKIIYDKKKSTYKRIENKLSSNSIIHIDNNNKMRDKNEEDIINNINIKHLYNSRINTLNNDKHNNNIRNNIFSWKKKKENKIDNMAYNYSYDILSENNKIFNM